MGSEPESDEKVSDGRSDLRPIIPTVTPRPAVAALRFSCRAFSARILF